MWQIKMMGMYGEVLYQDGEKDPYVEVSPAEGTITDERYNIEDDTHTN